MSDIWLENYFEIYQTEDGSLTLRSLLSETRETMHHRGGAFSETLLIYGEPLKVALEFGGRSVMSVGLGLGYNEFLIAANAIQRGISPDNFYLESFESIEFLKNQFLNAIQGPDSADPIYKSILERFHQALNVEPQVICDWLWKALQKENFLIRGALAKETLFQRKFSLIFYDAFSSKTSPELWNEDFLDQFLQKSTESQCLLTTYACTGALKRALKKNHFHLEIKEGFQSKRDRIFAKRSSS